MEERDAGGAAPCRSVVEVLHASEDLHALMAKRSTEHPVARQEDSIKIACDNAVNRWIHQEA
jgi:hypothetical protein